MLSLPGVRSKGHPTLMKCGHWSYWWVKVDGEHRCSACLNKLPKALK